MSSVFGTHAHSRNLADRHLYREYRVDRVSCVCVSGGKKRLEQSKSKRQSTFGIVHNTADHLPGCDNNKRQHEMNGVFCEWKAGKRELKAALRIQVRNKSREFNNLFLTAVAVAVCLRLLVFGCFLLIRSSKRFSGRIK